MEEPNDELPQTARKTLISLDAIYSINLLDRQILSVLIEECTIVIGLLIFPNFFGSNHNGPSFAMVQSLSLVHMLAAASARLSNRALGTARSAMLVVIPLNGWAAAHYFRASRTLTEDLQAID